MPPPPPNDPRRDPSWKPDPIKRVMGAPIIEEKKPLSHSLRPSPETWEAAKRWTPAGIVAALLIAFFTIGEDRIIRIARAFSAEEALLSEVQGLRADLATEREARAKVMARVHALERNQSSLCDFVSNMNGGRPNPTWCSEDGRTIGIATVQSPPPFKTTPAAWIYVPK